LARIKTAGAGTGALVTRLAAREDLPQLLALLEEWQGAGGQAERTRNPLSVPLDSDRLADVLDGDDCDLIVGLLDGQPLGMTVVWLTGGGPLAAAPVAALSHLVVAPQARRRGMGRSLVLAAASWAEERGADQLVAHVYPNLREANRFYARLGFAPLSLRRVAPVAALRRQLALPAGLRALEPVRPRRLLAARRAAGRPAAPGTRRSATPSRYPPP
jgi:GNAT superfamily N-acetyltransferase